ncbi:MAG TPA: hydrogenase 2 operon protein HybA [Anaerolineales bacterium]|nr:hydrogenase 2 operon protein HybA [Anaerolineae bacterium]HIQ00767.1 hydrogenase 2 operon protein HybA [Anaerolineales bacterium]
MTMDRRRFLKLSGVSLGAALLGTRGIGSVRGAEDGLGMLYDASRCVGCRACQMACKQWNGLPPESTDPQGLYESPRDLSAHTWTLIQLAEAEVDGERRQGFLKRQCMHCLHPACVSACPVGALRQTEYGAVIYDAERCIGCRYCMVACPFGVPKFEWEKPLPFIHKCTFCEDRLEAGLEPACAEACPAGAILFGKRAHLIAEAEDRIRNNPDKYVDHVYGKEELGGTSMLYISPIPFEALGLPILGPAPITELSETVAVYGTPSVAVSVATLLGGLYYWFTRQEKKLRAEEAARQEEKEAEP